MIEVYREGKKKKKPGLTRSRSVEVGAAQQPPWSEEVEWRHRREREADERWRERTHVPIEETTERERER
jgi:hypothetical protein